MYHTGIIQALYEHYTGITQALLCRHQVLYWRHTGIIQELYGHYTGIIQEIPNPLALQLARHMPSPQDMSSSQVVPGTIPALYQHYTSIIPALYQHYTSNIYTSIKPVTLWIYVLLSQTWYISHGGESVFTYPGKTLPICLSRWEPPGSYVQGPGPNARDLWHWPNVLWNTWHDI